MSEGGGDAAARMKLAGMLLQSGDARRALQMFQASAGDGTNPGALEGAGIAAFQLGEYATALSYLNRAPRTPATEEPRSIAELVVARDPLLSRIGRAERVRRATDNIAAVRGRLHACLPDAAAPAAGAVNAALADVTVKTARVPSGDRDALEDGVAAVGRAARALQEYCSPPDVSDRALVIIASLHAAAP
jgi:hypothetical protein